MRSKYFVAPALVLGGLVGGAESAPATINAAHVAPHDCRSTVYDSFENIHELSEAVRLNIELATSEDRNTSEDNAKKVTNAYVSNLEKRDNFIKENVSKVGSYTLEKSGIRIQLSSDSNWSLSHPQKFEETLEKAYRLADTEDPLQTIVNDCIADLIFEERALDGIWFAPGMKDLMDLTIIGGGEYCLARDRIMSRFDSVKCPTAGKTIYRPWGQWIQIAPGASKNRTVEESATLNLTHETDHWIRTNLGVRPSSKKKFEYAAYELGLSYRKVIAHEIDYAVFTLNED